MDPLTSAKCSFTHQFQSCYSDCCLFPAALFERGSVALRHLIILLFPPFFVLYTYTNSYFLFSPLLLKIASEQQSELEVKSPHKASVQRREAEMLLIGRWTRCLTSLPSGQLVGKLTHGYLWGTTQKPKHLSPLSVYTLSGFEQDKTTVLKKTKINNVSKTLLFST